MRAQLHSGGCVYCNCAPILGHRHKRRPATTRPFRPCRPARYFLVSARAWAPAGRRLSQNTSPPELRGMTSRHTTLTNLSLSIEEDERTRLSAYPRTLSPPNEACESSWSPSHHRHVFVLSYFSHVACSQLVRTLTVDCSLACVVRHLCVGVRTTPVTKSCGTG